jgi:hypothetical protein
MRTKILILTFLIFLFASCKKEDTVTSPPTLVQDLIPLTVGNYWIYKGVVLDVNGNPDSTAGVWKDSSVVSAQRIVAGKQAYEMTWYRNAQPSGLIYVAKDGDKYYVYFPTSPLPSLDSLANRWFLWIDPASQGWNVFNQQVKFVLDSASGLTVTGNLNVVASKGANETIVITAKNQTVQAEQFIWDVNLSGKIDQLPGSNVTASLKWRWYFSRGVGLVKYQTDPMTVRIVVPLVADTTMKFEGERNLIVNYKLMQPTANVVTMRNVEPRSDTFIFKKSFAPYLNAVNKVINR